MITGLINSIIEQTEKGVNDRAIIEYAIKELQEFGPKINFEDLSHFFFSFPMIANYDRDDTEEIMIKSKGYSRIKLYFFIRKMCQILDTYWYFPKDGFKDIILIIGGNEKNLYDSIIDSELNRTEKFTVKKCKDPVAYLYTDNIINREYQFYNETDVIKYIL